MEKRKFRSCLVRILDECHLAGLPESGVSARSGRCAGTPGRGHNGDAPTAGRKACLLCVKSLVDIESTSQIHRMLCLLTEYRWPQHFVFLHAKSSDRMVEQTFENFVDLAVLLNEGSSLSPRAKARDRRIAGLPARSSAAHWVTVQSR